MPLHCRQLPVLFTALSVLAGLRGEAAPPSFFETGQAFYQTQVEVEVFSPKSAGQRPANFVVRGIVIPLGVQHALVFDQELLRIAGVWSTAGGPPVTPMTMAQISYADGRRKVDGQHPNPTGPLLLTTNMHPGVTMDPKGLFSDPRPAGRPGDAGRGPLPSGIGHFDGIELSKFQAVLRYKCGEATVREWYETRDDDGVFGFWRHLEISTHSSPLSFALGAVENAGWAIRDPQCATAQSSTGSAVILTSNSKDVILSIQHDELVATMSGSANSQRLTLAWQFLSPGHPTTAVPPLAPAPIQPATPNAPTLAHERHWPQSTTSLIEEASLSKNGWVLDRIAVPEDNLWHRRIRAADLAFLDADRAAVVTFDGDIWLVTGFASPGASELTWHRYAAGLSEPLAIAAVDGIIQVHTKNGVVRLHDRDGNGEADWIENFSDLMLQSQSTRSFPLDMAMAPDGSTYVTQGGIVNMGTADWGGTGTPDTGAVLKIAPDGRSIQRIARGAREPFVAVNPHTGQVTGTDQQGNYIPASVAYVFRPGDSFGFLEENPIKLTPPLAWIPHEDDTSSTSQVWLMGPGMGRWDGRLLHLSYGTGRIFLISPDGDAPVPQAAVIPLGLETELPLLHARMHPTGDAVYLCGFQIWGTLAKTSWGLGRLRPGTSPIVTAIAAKSCTDGVILEFAEAIDPTSLKVQNISAHGWNYFRSSAYGSGRYKLGVVPGADVAAGTTALGIAQLVRSVDGRSVFVHLPHLPPMMQLEIRHEFRLANGSSAQGAVYFTIHQPHDLDLVTAGFPAVDLTKTATAIIAEADVAPTPEVGRVLAEKLGCVVCHSTDGSTQGKIGPTWKGLFGARQTMADGSSQRVDEAFVREKILEPTKRRVTTGPGEMPSYRGIASDAQIEALVLYIKSLTRTPAAGQQPGLPSRTLKRPRRFRGKAARPQL